MDASRIAAARVTTPPLAADAAKKPGAAAGVPFSDHIQKALENANTELNAADTEARKIAEGKGDIVEAMVSLSKAELSLRHVVTLRNRVLESYQRIMRLQL